MADNLLFKSFKSCHLYFIFASLLTTFWRAESQSIISFWNLYCVPLIIIVIQTEIHERTQVRHRCFAGKQFKLCNLLIFAMFPCCIFDINRAHYHAREWKSHTFPAVILASKLNSHSFPATFHLAFYCISNFYFLRLLWGNLLVPLQSYPSFEHYLMSFQLRRKPFRWFSPNGLMRKVFFNAAFLVCF
jgi:hypothetical protein